MRVHTLVARLAFAALIAIGAQPATSAMAAASEDVGESQSPIDIRAQDVTYVHHLGRVHFTYPDASLEVINTGSPDHEATVRAVVGTPASIRLGHTTYTLTQFHFHTVSEHRLDGTAFPMEMHLVHQGADGSLLVIGVLIEAGHTNRELQKIFRDLPTDETQTRTVEDFDLDDLLPDDDDDTYRYQGSLTTPPFTEGVQWIVYDEPLEMSPTQIAAFRTVFPDGNTREPQPLNDRQILSDVEQHHGGPGHGSGGHHGEHG